MSTEYLQGPCNDRPGTVLQIVRVEYATKAGHEGDYVAMRVFTTTRDGTPSIKGIDLMGHPDQFEELRAALGGNVEWVMVTPTDDAMRTAQRG